MREPRAGVALRAPKVYVWSEDARELLAWHLDLIDFAVALTGRRSGCDPRPEATCAAEPVAE